METLEFKTDGPVAWVWLNQPQRLNAIRQQTLDELGQTFGVLDRDPSVRAIVLAARGPAFSAGFDVSWMIGLTPDRAAGGLDGVRKLYAEIEACSKPVIAAIDGAALGGGLLLALVSDFRLASERASFGAPEVKIGIFPSLDLIPRLERMVGLAAAKRIVILGESIDASEAHRIGLADRIVPSAQLEREAQSLAGRLAALPPVAVEMCKAAFAAARQPGYEAWEKEQFAACWAVPEREQAMRAFLRRRPS